jgi:aquaporin Z
MAAPPTSLHWPEYLIEAAAIGIFMVSAAVFAAILYHPSSPVSGALSNELVRRALMGLAMGSTAVAIIYSPWGQRSGAHMNPAVTLTFFRLGKVRRLDLLGYVTAQFAGATSGIAAAAVVLRGIVSDPSVHYVATLPGPTGDAVAFIAEAAISFVLMLTVLAVSNHARLAPFTGLCAGLLVWTYITFEAPLSGMSMNPARTLGSALLARNYLGLWIYFTAPPLGMLLAAELFMRSRGARVICAKLHHPHSGPCIFGCGLKPSRPEGIEAA